MDRIAILFPGGTQRGGAEALLIHFLRFNAPTGLERFVVVFLRAGPMPELAKNLGYEVFVIESKRLRNLGNVARVQISLFRLFRKTRIRAIVSWMSKGHLYASLPAFFCGIPSIWYQHGVSGGGFLDQIATALPTNLVICCSKAAANAQRQLFIKRRVGVVYPAADLERLKCFGLDCRSARACLGVDWKGSVVAMFARMERWKGIDVFVSSAVQIFQKDPDIKFVLVGGAHEFDPLYKEQIETRIAELGLQDRILLVGQKPMDEVPLWMAAADIIVHPATGTEPFGMVIVEAMAMGRPVIASRIGGIPEIIESGLNGILIAPGDSGVLASVTVQLLEDVEFRSALGYAAKERAMMFSVEKFCASVNAAISSVSR